MTYSACPPIHPPISTYPYAAPGRAGFTFRQMPVLPSLQFRHRPQAMLNGTDTRSPTLMNSTSRPGFDHLAGDLMAKDQSRRRCSAASHHVLVAAANVGGDDLENHAVLAFPPAEPDQLRKVDGFHLDLPGPI